MGVSCEVGPRPEWGPVTFQGLSNGRTLVRASSFVYFVTDKTLQGIRENISEILSVRVIAGPRALPTPRFWDGRLKRDVGVAGWSCSGRSSGMFSPGPRQCRYRGRWDPGSVYWSLDSKTLALSSLA